MLTDEQIQNLFTFCEHHSVHYYDVQVELVDHLANAVEEEMKTDTKISFEEALKKVHRSFGVMGFAPLVQEKQKFAEKQSKRLFWKLFKNQFRWPKAILFFLLYAAFFTFCSSEYFFLKYIIGGVMFAGMVIWIMIAYLRRGIKKSGKKFLVMQFSWLYLILYLPVNFINIVRPFTHKGFLPDSPNQFFIAIISILISVYIIVFIAAFQTFSDIKKELYETYPEVFPLET